MEKAFALAPDNSEVVATFSNILNFSGEPGRGLQMMERAIAMDAIVPANYEFQLGRSLMLLGDYERSIVQFNRMAERAPAFIPAHVLAAFALMALGRAVEAEKAVGKIREINPRFTVKAAGERLPYRDGDIRDRFLGRLQEAGLPAG